MLCFPDIAIQADNRLIGHNARTRLPQKLRLSSRRCRDAAPRHPASAPCLRRIRPGTAFRASQTTAAPGPAPDVSLDFMRGSLFPKIKSHYSSIPFALSKDMLWPPCRSIPTQFTVQGREAETIVQTLTKHAINLRSGHEQTVRPNFRITHPAHHEEEDEEFQTACLGYPTNTPDEFTKTGSKQARMRMKKNKQKR